MERLELTHVQEEEEAGLSNDDQAPDIAEDEIAWGSQPTMQKP